MPTLASAYTLVTPLVAIAVSVGGLSIEFLQARAQPAPGQEVTVRRWSPPEGLLGSPASASEGYLTPVESPFETRD